MDSLRVELENTHSESARAYVLIEMAKIAYGLDSATAFGYPKKAIATFEREKDSFGLGKSYSVLGGVHYDYGQMRSAEENLRQAKHIFEDLMRQDTLPEVIKEWSLSTLNLASTLGNQNLHGQEIEYLLELAPIAEKYDDHRTNAILHSNLGILAVNRENYDKAYEYFQGNELRYEKADAANQYSMDRLMFAYSLIQLDSLDAAKEALEKASKVLDDIPNTPLIQLYHQIWGDYHVAEKEYKKALASYDRSAEIIEAKNLSYQAIQMNLSYAEVYGLMGNPEKQRRYMLRFYERAKGNNKGLELVGLRELAKLEEKAGNESKALAYLNQYLALNDGLHSEELTAQANRLEQQFQNEKKERQILELENRNNQTALSLERKKSQNYLLYFLLGSALSMLIVGYLIFRNRQRKTALKETTQEQQIQKLKNDRERRRFGSVMEGVERERKRLAADLHDGLGGRLSGVSIKLSQLAEEPSARGITPQIETILSGIHDSLQELRGVARNLMPETLARYGLQAALEDYCSTLKKKDTDIVLQFYENEEFVESLGGDEVTDRKKNNLIKSNDRKKKTQELDAGEKNTKEDYLKNDGQENNERGNRLLMIYRIMQELIGNAVKHSEAKEILVQYIHDGQKIDITIEDDGTGFQQENLNGKSGMGLANVKSRIDYLDGKMDIRSAPNEGTSVNIEIKEL